MMENKPSRAGRTPSPGCVGFAKMKGTTKVLIIDEALSRCVFSTGFAFLKPKEILEPEFLYYYLLSTGFNDEKNGCIPDGIMASIKDSAIKSIRIPVPELDEQRRIVTTLHGVFGRIADCFSNAENVSLSTSELIDTILKKVFQNDASDWKRIPFDESILKVPSSPKIKRKDFKSSGPYPIISQEMEFINGYWNHAEDLLRIDRPVVVFGDHTKTLKYVDFEFVRGADGSRY